MSQNTKKNNNDFSFVQRNEKIHDHIIEGKPIGYFKDAFIRFRKNKMNLIAAIMLMILVMLAIFVPAVTTKNYTEIEEQLSYLPPRVPLLEKIGIFDGKRRVKQEAVDLSTIDPETGLGLPKGYLKEFVDTKTLKNFEKPAMDAGETALGGVVQFTTKKDTELRIESKEYYNFDKATNDYILIDVDKISEGVVVDVYITTISGATKIGSISESGKTQINIFDDIDDTFLYSKVFLGFNSTEDNQTVTLNNIAGYKNNDERIFLDDGYRLSTYENNIGITQRMRLNHYTIYASFVYDAYASVFSEKVINAFPGSEYDRILAENPNVVPVEDPENPGQLIFPEGFVIKRVYKENPGIIIDGVNYKSYDVLIDYMQYKGYDKMPSFFFGTDASGKDLFGLVFLGLRTSLVIGLVVALINITFGVVYGAISGYYGGKVDLIMERFTEIIGRIPWLVTLSIFNALLGPGFLTLVLILVISGWIGIASVTRTQFYRYKGREYVYASRTLGAKDSRLIFRHILPNGIGTIITSSILMIPGVIFSESSISYLGFGIGYGQDINLGFVKLTGVSLGVLIADAQSAIRDFPHLTIYPAIIISLLMISFNIFGNGLRDALNPSLRGTE